MARSNKFTSINFNESYGKPQQLAGSASSSFPSSSAPGGASSSSAPGSKPRLPTQGGMLVLTRRARAPPPSPSPSPKPPGGKLGVPSPLNLPSLKREHSGTDPPPPVASTPPVPGWPKDPSNAFVSMPEMPPAPGRVGAPSPDGLPEPVNGDLKSPALKPPVDRPDVYVPPRVRAMQANGGLAPNNLAPSPPPTASKAVVLRGEDFPTLQASLVRPPTPPQQQRQKELHQKQRDQQLELKEQQQRLQQLSQQQKTQALKQDAGDSLQLQPAQPTRAQISADQALKEEGFAAGKSGVITERAPEQARDAECALSRSPPPVKLNQVSDWADDERESRQQPGPQRRNPEMLVGRGDPSTDEPRIDQRQSGRSNESEQSWPPTVRSHVPAFPRNEEYARSAIPARGYWPSADENHSSEGLNLVGRSNDNSRGAFSRWDGGFRRGRPADFAGFGRDFAPGHHQEGYGKEKAFPGYYGRGGAGGTFIRDAVRGREGFFPRGNGLVREAYEREAMKGYNNRDANGSWQRGRSNFGREGGYRRWGPRWDYDNSNTGNWRGSFSVRDRAASPPHPRDQELEPTRDAFDDHPRGENSFPKRNEADSAQDLQTSAGSRRTGDPSYDGVHDFEKGSSEVELDRSYGKTVRLSEEGQLEVGKEERSFEFAKEGGGYEHFANEAMPNVQEQKEADARAAAQSALEASCKLPDERRSGEWERSYSLVEEQRRQEASRHKLADWEECMALREADKRRDEAEQKKKYEEDGTFQAEILDTKVAKQEDYAGVDVVNMETQWEGEDNVAVGTMGARNMLRPRPSSASSSNSSTQRASWEEHSQRAFPRGTHSSFQNAGPGFVDSKFGHKSKFTRPKSPISWRREASTNGSGPISKLFSSPYIESSGFH